MNQAETGLFNAEVPATEQLNLIVDGGNYSVLRGLPEFAFAYAFGPNGQLHDGSPNGFKAYNLNIQRSQLIKTTTAGSSPVVTTQHGIAFAKDAIALVSRKMENPMPGTGAISADIDVDGFGLRLTHSFNTQTMSNQFVIDVLWGAAVLRPDFGIEVRC